MSRDLEAQGLAKRLTSFHPTRQVGFVERFIVGVGFHDAVLGSVHENCVRLGAVPAAANNNVGRRHFAYYSLSGNVNESFLGGFRLCGHVSECRSLSGALFPF